ncbi:MAG: hypothetical protein M1456_07220 [Actinobacteria bacterium]|nr:hypothetical protein [Actinomycetota bacterium]
MDILEIIRELKRDETLREEMRAILLTEELRALPEASVRLEGTVAQLAQKIDDMETTFDRRLTRLEEGQASLQEGQARLEKASDRRLTRLEEGQARLEEGQASLRTEVGRLSQIVGGVVEDDASSVIVTVLERKGWWFLSEPTSAQVNGEIDVLARVEDPDGNGATVIIEAKTRLRPADVRHFAANLDGLLADAQVAERCFAYVYGLRVYDGSVDAARELGLGILCPDGERAPAA